MVANKRRKSSRLRGSRTHGWGHKKRHRGAGSRGGRGNAGSGKRADSKKPSFWGNPKWQGKCGFVKQNAGIAIHAINLKQLEQLLPSLIALKQVEEKGGMVIVDLEKLGFNKLLASGEIHQKLQITVPYVSKSACEKVSAAGGKVEGAAGSED